MPRSCAAVLSNKHRRPYRQDTRHGSSPRELLLTRPNGGLAYWDELASGMRIPITDAHFTVREGEIPLVVATTFSEAVMI